MVTFIFTGLFGTYLSNKHSDDQIRQAKIESDRVDRAGYAREMIQYLSQEHIAAANMIEAIGRGNLSKGDLAATMKKYDASTENFVNASFRSNFMIMDALGPPNVIKTAPPPAREPTFDMHRIFGLSANTAATPMHVIDPRKAWDNLFTQVFDMRECIRYVYSHAARFAGKQPKDISCGSRQTTAGQGQAEKPIEEKITLERLVRDDVGGCFVSFIKILHAYTAPTFPGPDDETRGQVVATLQTYLDTDCKSATELSPITLPPD